MHTKAMEESAFNGTSCKHRMIGGDDPNSYAHNSQYQKQLLISADELIPRLIDKHLDGQNPCFNPQNTFAIADFGCSIGPNTFLAVENIISAVEKKYKKSNQNQTPDFQVFFNDLIDNDFNTLFKNIPSSRKYFVAAVPGSFYTRLCPKKTIHFAHCSTALHWLSKTPKGVTKSGINEGRIHYLGGGEEVKEAYAVQYEEDFGGFLRARGDELVDGALMVLVILGFGDGVDYSDSSIGMAFEILGSCLKDMAKLGKITKEKVNSFNLPFYYPTPSEVKALIEADGSFHIEKIAKLAAPMRQKPDPQVVTSHLRAVIGILIEQHFGNGVVDELFKCHYEKLVKSPILVDEKYWKETNYFVFLKKK